MHVCKLLHLDDGRVGSSGRTRTTYVWWVVRDAFICAPAPLAMWPVTEVEIPGRGIGLVAARDIQAGETVLVDEPLLLVVHTAFAAHACAQCLRMLDAGRQRGVGFTAHLSRSNTQNADVAPALCSSCESCRRATRARRRWLNGTDAWNFGPGSARRLARLLPRCLAALTARSCVLRWPS